MRLDKINSDLSIYQYEDGFCYGTDAVLLSAFTAVKKGDVGVELGTGSGIVSILLGYHKSPAHIYAFEVQPEYASLARKNAQMCGYGDKISVICDNLKNYAAHGIEDVDFVFSNPPYMKTDSGKLNENTKKLISRHETHCDINDICRAAGRMLKNGGNFFAVYRPDRMSDIIFAMKNNNLEPKEIVFVQSHADKAPNLFLIKAKKDGLGGGLKIHKPLVLYTQKAVMTEELDYIYRYGRMGGKHNGK
ncbi:MAG: SAM-dependent methyltransferase [Ruminococcaceae bacterium]|nr:SAM-dependent methyltransferase [Oscillospiraceae bacterium]